MYSCSVQALSGVDWPRGEWGRNKSSEWQIPKGKILVKRYKLPGIR